MIHEVHNLRMLCGDIVAVQAFSSRATRGFPVEDTVAINLRFASGALGSFMLSDTAACAHSWEQTSQENKAYATYADEDCYVIAGTFGSLPISTMRLKTYAKAEDRSWWKPFEVSVAEMTRDGPLAHQIEHFGRVVRGEAEPCRTFASPRPSPQRRAADRSSTQHNPGLIGGDEFSGGRHEEQCSTTGNGCELTAVSERCHGNPRQRAPNAPGSVLLEKPSQSLADAAQN